MARSHRSETLSKIETTGVIPLFFHRDIALCCSVAQALFEAGCEILEFTDRGEGATETFAALVSHVRAEFPDAIIGAGSIHDPYTAAHFLSLGADFVVGPCLSEPIASLCNRHQVLYIPGCATVTEILAATAVGCELIKIFPADALGGPDFIKAVRGPLPWLKTIPTGGVKATAESLGNWFGAGVSAVGLGSDLISKSVLQRRDFEALKTTTRRLLSTIGELRHGTGGK